LWQEFRDRIDALSILIAGVVPGNHDRDIVAEPGLPVRPDGIALGAWTVRHGHERIRDGKTIIGHWHSCVRLDGVPARCYVIGRDSLVLPAYSSDAAGVNVWRHSQWRGRRCIAIAENRVVDLGVIPGATATTKSRNARSRPW